MEMGAEFDVVLSMVIGNVRQIGILSLLCSVLGCQDAGQCESTSSSLFGRPSANTGLTTAQCMPTCHTCEGNEFQASEPSVELLTYLDTFQLKNPPARLSSDPYLSPQSSGEIDNANFVCVAEVDTAMSQYALSTRPIGASLDSEHAFVTHRGPCGLCSSFEDLVVYMRNPDLTEPVRACGALGFTDGQEAQYDCLLEIGFSEPCADIWLYNILNTRELCLAECLEYLQEPHHLPDGSLNPCIQCDEDKSGPTFKDVAGRTRRNSGLASGLCRPCESVFPLEHRYGWTSESG